MNRLHWIALRWGTLYNFRFDSDAPPQEADLIIGLFKPGSPAAVIVTAVGPSAADCDVEVAACCDLDGNSARDDSCAWCSCGGPCAPIVVALGDLPGIPGKAFAVIGVRRGGKTSFTSVRPPR